MWPTPSDQLFVCDLDGTLLRPDATLSPHAQRSLSAMLEAGLQFTIASARSTSSIQTKLRGIDLRLPVIELNGAFVSDPVTGRHLDAAPLEAAGAVAAVHALAALGVPAILTTWDGTTDNVSYPDGLTEAAGWFISEKEAQRDSRLRRSDDLLVVASSEAVAMVTAFVAHEAAGAAVARLRAAIGGRTVLTSAAHGYCAGWTELTVQGQVANKGDGIRRLQRIRRLSGQPVTAIGDHLNDLPMFDVATTSIAPANSVPEVLARADLVVASNEVDGVIEHLLTSVAPTLPGWK